MASRGPRLPLVLAGLASVAALVLLTQVSNTTSLPYLLVCYVVLGLGCGLVNAPISNTAVSGMPNSQAGVAASVASASRQTGNALGVAITGSIVAGGTGQRARLGQPRRVGGARRLRGGGRGARLRFDHPASARHGPPRS